MSENRNVGYIELRIPSWVDKSHIEIATKQLVEDLSTIRENEDHMRGYIWAANQDGFPIVANLLKKEELLDVCIRAFWFAFEKLASEVSR